METKKENKEVATTLSNGSFSGLNGSLTALNGSLGSLIAGTLNQSSEINEKLLNNPSYGAAFSLASLDQPNNSRGSLNGINTYLGGSLGNFDTSTFLNKSGSFEALHGMEGYSSIFKTGGFAAEFANANHNAANANDTPTKVTNVQLPLTTMTQQSPQNKSIVPANVPSNVITNIPQTVTMNGQYMPYGNNALIQPKENEKRIIERKDENSKFVDVTPFLTLPQHEAAKKLGIPSSTLAKRWKEASCNRKWPYRTVSKLDKEILTLLKNVENAKAELSPSVEANLGILLKRRQEELKTVLVRL